MGAFTCYWPRCHLLYNLLWPTCLSAPAKFVLRSVGVFTSDGWGISGQESAVYRENLRLDWSWYWHQRAPEPSSSTGWNQIFILWWRTYSREKLETDFAMICMYCCAVCIVILELRTFRVSGRNKQEQDILEINNQLCREVWWYIIFCHLLLFLLGGILCQGQCPVHSESFSKLVPPGTTVLKTHTVADGLRNVEAVVTQFRHDPPRRIGSVEKEARPPTLTQRTASTAD